MLPGNKWQINERITKTNERVSLENWKHLGMNHCKEIDSTNRVQILDLALFHFVLVPFEKAGIHLFFSPKYSVDWVIYLW